MAAWGGGLYDSDFARDLKATINGIWRAPLSDEELLAEIGAPISAGLDDIEALDHWLVLADQIERAGMPRREVFERAIGIIASGQDLAALEALDAGKGVLAKRRKAHSELLERLRRPRAAKQRRPMSQPQPLLFEVGDALTWPTDKGECINPDVTEDQLHLLGGFTRDGWGFGLVSAVGHHYEVLAYHSVQALKWRRSERPSREFAVYCARSEHHFGTMTQLQFERLKLDRLGTVAPHAFGPPQDPALAHKESRKAALENFGLSRAFSWDAQSNAVWPGPKFMFSAPAPAPTKLDNSVSLAVELEEDTEFSPLPPDRPATRAHYFNVMRTNAGALHSS